MFLLSLHKTVIWKIPLCNSVALYHPISSLFFLTLPPPSLFLYPPLSDTLFLCLSPSFSLLCLFIWDLCQVFPQSVCLHPEGSIPLTNNTPTPQPPSSSHPATLTPSHPHPALPRVLLSNCPPRELVPVSANQNEGTYFLNRAVAQRGDIAFSTVEPAFTYGVHTLPQVIGSTHCTCMPWRIEPFDQSPCRLIYSM